MIDALHLLPLVSRARERPGHSSEHSEFASDVSSGGESARAASPHECGGADAVASSAVRIARGLGVPGAAMVCGCSGIGTGRRRPAVDGAGPSSPTRCPRARSRFPTHHLNARSSRHGIECRHLHRCRCCRRGLAGAPRRGLSPNRTRRGFERCPRTCPKRTRHRPPSGDGLPTVGRPCPRPRRWK